MTLNDFFKDSCDSSLQEIGTKTEENCLYHHCFPRGLRQDFPAKCGETAILRKVPLLPKAAWSTLRELKVSTLPGTATCCGNSGSAAMATTGQQTS